MIGAQKYKNNKKGDPLILFDRIILNLSFDLITWRREIFLFYLLNLPYLFYLLGLYHYKKFANKEQPLFISVSSVQSLIGLASYPVLESALTPAVSAAVETIVLFFRCWWGGADSRELRERNMLSVFQLTHPYPAVDTPLTPIAPNPHLLLLFSSPLHSA